MISVMQRDSTGEPRAFSKTDNLRRQVSDAKGDAGRLAALLALAQHYADASDGVNGLATSREARMLALCLKDYAAAASALSAASISHYHRSDYVSAVATAMDAWDFAARVDSPLEIAKSYFAIGLSMMALGKLDAAASVVEKGLTMCASSPALLGERIRLVGLQAMLHFFREDISETERLCAEAAAMSEGSPIAERALCHGNWGIALLRCAEKLLDKGADVGDMLTRSREHLEIALGLAEEEYDEMRIADRMASLGMVALLTGDTTAAAHLLSEAQHRSLSLDYVRTAVSSAVYLGKLDIQLGNRYQAVETLRQAVTQARRGVAADILPAAQLLLADALDMRGLPPDADQAAQLRTSSEKLRMDNAVSRGLAAEDAQRLAARILG